MNDKEIFNFEKEFVNLITGIKEYGMERTPNNEKIEILSNSIVKIESEILK